MKRVEYNLPILGFAEVPLYGEAEEIYKFLEEHDQIIRLNNLNQLGIISNVIQTAHHPKFEYTFLLLYLIEKIKDLKGLYPLNRNVVRDITGTELLKIWALLLPIGHLPGTFPVEKAILRYLFENSTAKDNFINVIKSKSMKEYANKIILNQNIYSFYHVFSLVKISRYCHNKTQASFCAKALEALSMYCQYENKECINSLKELFSKLRRFSYIMLDGYYTGARNIFNIEDLNKISNVIPNIYFENMINSLDSYLINQIYKNKKCTIAEIILYQGIYEELNKHQSPMSLVTNYMYTKHNADIYDIYNRYKRNWKIEPDNFDDFLVIETNRINIFRQEDEIKNILSKFIPKKERLRQILFDVDRPPGGSKSTITIYVRNDFKFKRVGLVPGLVREALAETFRNESVKYNPFFKLPQFKDSPEIHLLLKKQINERNFKNIFMALLKIVFNESIGSFRFISRKLSPLLDLPEGFYDKKPYMMDKLFKNREMDDPELIELNKLVSKLIANKSYPRLVIFTSNIELHRKARRKQGFVIGELDGSVLEISGTKLFLYFLEAKKKTRSYSESRKQLNRIKRYLKPQYKKRNLTIIRHVHKNSKSAYLKIKIS